MSARCSFHLREHMNQHNDTRPYVCDQCPKAFYKRVQLRQHKLSHGQHKYVCQICGQAFNRRGNLSSHIKRHSSSDGTYTCSVSKTKKKKTRTFEYNVKLNLNYLNFVRVFVLIIYHENYQIEF